MMAQRREVAWAEARADRRHPRRRGPGPARTVEEAAHRWKRLLAIARRQREEDG